MWTSYPKKQNNEQVKPFCSVYPVLDESLWNMMSVYLRSRGLDYVLARSNGWYPSSHATDTEPRVVIPASTSSPDNKFWQARALTGAEKRWQSPHNARGDAVISVWPERQQPEGTVIVEGPMDALAAAGCGYLGIALLGNTPPTAALERAARLTVPPAIILADSDALAAALGIMKRLYAVIHKHFYILSPYPYKDLAEMPQDYREFFFKKGVTA